MTIDHRYTDDSTIVVQLLPSAVHVYQSDRHIGYASYQEHPAQGYIAAIRLGVDPFVELEHVTYELHNAVNLIVEQYREQMVERQRSLSGSRLSW